MSKDSRVRVPGTAIKMKHHRAMCGSEIPSRWQNGYHKGNHRPC